jgi:hypothetical protein
MRIFTYISSAVLLLFWSLANFAANVVIFSKVDLGFSKASIFLGILLTSVFPTLLAFYLMYRAMILIAPKGPSPEATSESSGRHAKGRRKQP